MYLFLECLAVLALVAVVADLLFTICVVLLALGQGISAMWRVARKATQPLTAHETGVSLALQGAILTSTERSAR